MPTKTRTDAVLHLLRRATFGPTPEDVAAATAAGPERWLDRQLSPGDLPDPVADAVTGALPLAGMSTAEIRRAVPAYGWQAMIELGGATLARQIWSTRQLFEVMVDFWSNHLNVPSPTDVVWDCRGQFDRVVREHALGRFSDLLLASARSPAVLRYFANDVSDRRGANEHYGRELLELHTVGPDAGVTERDVRDSARLLTGRTVDSCGAFGYQPAMHWTGPVRVLGFSHPNADPAGGLAAGDAYLTYLAGHPATAARLARKLAVRFVSDDPPRRVVDRLAAVYLDSGTAIRPVLRELFATAEFWESAGAKVRRPLEDMVATARILGVLPGDATGRALEALYWLADGAGQAPLAARAPEGYPDVATAWQAAGTQLWSWTMHRALGQGWFPGLRQTELGGLLPAAPGTFGGYLDALADRLLLQPLGPAERAALLEFSRWPAATRVSGTEVVGALPGLVPLLLDSLSHAVR